MIPVIAPAITFPKNQRIRRTARCYNFNCTIAFFQLLLQLQSDFHKLKSSYIKVKSKHKYKNNYFFPSLPNTCVSEAIAD